MVAVLKSQGPRLSSFHIALLPSVYSFDALGAALTNLFSQLPTETVVRIEGLTRCCTHCALVWTRNGPAHGIVFYVLCFLVLFSSCGDAGSHLPTVQPTGHPARAAVFRRRKGSRGGDLLPPVTSSFAAALTAAAVATGATSMSGRPPLAVSANTMSPATHRLKGAVSDGTSTSPCVPLNSQHSNGCASNAPAGGVVGVAAGSGVCGSVSTGSPAAAPVSNTPASSSASCTTVGAMSSSSSSSSKTLPSLAVSLSAFTPGVHSMLPRLCGVPFVTVLQSLKTDELSEEDNQALLASVAPNVLRRSLRTTMLTVLSQYCSGLWAAFLAPAVIRAVSAG